MRDRVKKSLIIHQSSYIRKIIVKFKMQDAKSLSVPADAHVILHSVNSDVEKTSVIVPYREAVGFLVFLAAVSRPDYSLCRQFNQSFG